MPTGLMAALVTRLADCLLIRLAVRRAGRPRTPRQLAVRGESEVAAHRQAAAVCATACRQHLATSRASLSPHWLHLAQGRLTRWSGLWSGRPQVSGPCSGRLRNRDCAARGSVAHAAAHWARDSAQSACTARCARRRATSLVGLRTRESVRNPVPRPAPRPVLGRALPLCCPGNAAVGYPYPQALTPVMRSVASDLLPNSWSGPTTAPTTGSFPIVIVVGPSWSMVRSKSAGCLGPHKNVF
jgi:hypothetical protein